MNLLERRTIGLDFHDYSAQLIDVRYENGKIALQSYSRIVIPPSVIVNGEIVKEEELKKLITSLFQNANPAPILTREVLLVFPATRVFTHIFKFPPTFNEEEIKNALPYEAETVIPFAIQDMYWDFVVIDTPQEPNAGKAVLFSAIVKKTADSYRTMLESMGFIPYFFGVEAESLKYGLLKQIENSPGTIVIDINTLSTNYIVFKNGVIKDFFSSNEGGKSLVNQISTTHQTNEDTVLEEIEKNTINKNYTAAVTAFMEKQYKIAQKILSANESKDPTLKIKTVLLTGEFINLPHFFETAKTFFPDRDIELGDPRKNLAINLESFRPVAKEKEISNQYYVYFVHAIGIAIKGLLDKAHAGINLLPEHLKQNRVDKKIKMFATLASVIFAVVSLSVATFISYTYGQLYFERQTLEAQKSSIDQFLYGTRYQEIRDEINNFNKEVLDLSTIDTSLFSVPTVLHELQSRITPGVRLTGLTFADEGLTVELNGVAKTRENLLETHSKLKSTEFVEEVITPVSSYDSKYDTSFIIKLKLNFKKLPGYGNVSTPR